MLRVLPDTYAGIVFYKISSTVTENILPLNLIFIGHPTEEPEARS